MANSFKVNVSTASNRVPKIVSTDRRRSARELASFFMGLAAGLNKGSVEVQTDTEASAKATGTVTCATPVATNTVTINGTAITFAQKNARATVTHTTSGIDVDDTVTITVGGVDYVFTAKATENLVSGHFKANGTDAQSATSLAACINAHPVLSLLMTALGASAVTKIRAIAVGTGPNAWGLASSDAQLAVSAATFTNGAAAANNQCDFGDTDPQAATALADAINASTTNIIKDHVTASAASAVVTLTSKHKSGAGNMTTLASSGSTVAVSGARLTGGTGADGTATSFTF